MRVSSSLVADAIRRHHSDDIQITIGQAVVVAQAIVASGPRANVLVFGCGNDSKLWYELNRGGHTLFLENHPTWLRRVGERWPELTLHQIDYGDRTVESSLPIDEDPLRQYPVPGVLKQRKWDVVLIDSPHGHRPNAPGRSLPIYWTSRIATQETHVFVDDSNRRLEKEYAKYFFARTRPWNIEIPRLTKDGKNKGSMLWSIGLPSAEEPLRATARRRRDVRSLVADALSQSSPIQALRGELTAGLRRARRSLRRSTR